MSFPVIETLTGSINGVNRTFYTSADYRPGSPRVWRNGLLLRQDLIDGWVELGGRGIRLNEAPLTTDVLRVYFIPLV